MSKGVRAEKVKFPPHTPLRAKLNCAVDHYFQNRKKKKRSGGLGIFMKTLAIGTWGATSWVLLVFFAVNWWQALLAGASLGLAVAGIGFNVGHDGGHPRYGLE